MAKRFTDTDKWKKPLIKKAEAPYKLLWLYILDDCDTAGIWQTDFEVASLRIGETIDEATAKEIFKEKVVFLDGGEKWFIPSFIEFQYGKLQENNRAHTKAISALKKYNLLNEYLEVKPLTSPLQGAMVEVEVEEEDKEEVEVVVVVPKTQKKSEPKTEPEITYPFQSDEFTEKWEHWKEYKKKEFQFKYKSAQSEQAALSELANLSDGYEDKAIAIIIQSMAKGWKGFFELKTDSNVKGNSGKQSEADKHAEMQRNFAKADAMFGDRKHV